MVVHFHGDWFRRDTLHTQNQLVQERPGLAASLGELLSQRTLVVLGYGGWDDIFTRSLISIIHGSIAPVDVLWAFYGSDESRLTTEYGMLLERLKPGMARGRVILYKGIDVHTFLPELALAFRECAPQTMRSPPRDLEGHASIAEIHAVLSDLQMTDHFPLADDTLGPNGNVQLPPFTSTEIGALNDGSVRQSRNIGPAKAHEGVLVQDITMATLRHEHPTSAHPRAKLYAIILVALAGLVGVYALTRPPPVTEKTSAAVDHMVGAAFPRVEETVDVDMVSPNDDVRSTPVTEDTSADLDDVKSAIAPGAGGTRNGDQLTPDDVPNLPGKLTISDLPKTLRVTDIEKGTSEPIQKAEHECCGLAKFSVRSEKMKVKLSITGLSGTVLSAVPEDDGGNRPLALCLARKLKKSTFRKVQKERIDTVVLVSLCHDPLYGL